MICPKCSSDIPDNLMACPACARTASAAAVALYQREFLAKVFTGDLALKSPAIKGVRHIRMFGVMQAFCGADCTGYPPRRFVFYNELDMRFCEPCRAAIEGIRAAMEVLAAVAAPAGEASSFPSGKNDEAQDCGALTEAV